MDRADLSEAIVRELNQSQGGIYMVGSLEDGVDDWSKGVSLSL